MGKDWKGGGSHISSSPALVKLIIRFIEHFLISFLGSNKLLTRTSLMKLPLRPPQQCTLLVWRVGTTGHLFSTFTGKVDWVSTLIEISFNFHLMRVRQCSLQLLGSLVLSAVVGILGMVLVGTSRSFIVSFWLKMQQQQMFTHSPLLTVYTEFHCTKNWN